jgi:hypothetical protein
VKFRVDGKLYEFDLDSLTFDEAELLEEHTSLGIDEFQAALSATRVKAVRAMVLIGKRRAGEQVEWADLGGLDLVELSMSIIEENGIDIDKARNGENSQAVAALTQRLAARKTGRPSRKQASSEAS